MKPILYNRHEGRPIAVLGGGPSLIEDTKVIPKDSILIGVNHHATLHFSCDYAAFVDDPSTVFGLLMVSYKYKGRRLSTVSGHSDFELPENYYRGGYTSKFATWAACYMGGDPVLLCGMDCDRSKGRYFYDNRPLDLGKKRNKAEYWTRNWGFIHTKSCRPHVVRAVSGPLTEVFGRYEP